MRMYVPIYTKAEARQNKRESKQRVKFYRAMEKREGRDAVIRHQAAIATAVLEQQKREEKAARKRRGWFR